jgi:hypothetical protein
VLAPATGMTVPARLIAAAACLILLAGGAAAGSITGRIEVGSTPAAVSMHSGSRTLYVVTEEGIAFVDLTSGDVVDSFTVTPPPEAVALDLSRGHLWVLKPHPRSGARPGELSVLDASDGTEAESFTTKAGPSAVGIDPRPGLVYLAAFEHGGVEVFDAAQLTRVRTLGGPEWADGKVGRPVDVVVDDKRGVALVSTTTGYLVKIRGTRVVAKKRVLSTYDDHLLALDRRNGLVYAAQLDAGTVAEIRIKDLTRLRRFEPRHSPWDVAVDPRLGVLGVVTHSNEATYFESLDLESRRWLARVDTGLGANDVATAPGEWSFYITDSFGEAVLVAPGEDNRPTSVLDVGDDATMSAGESFQGLSTDDRSGIAGVMVVFENEAETHEVAVTLSCTTPRRCTWTGEAPQTPGVYEVRTRATDVARNSEIDADPTTVTVLP